MITLGESNKNKEMEQLNKSDEEMDAAGDHPPEVDGMLRAQTHVYNQIFNLHNSLSLKCAVMLGIPDIIHSSHEQSITLSQLASALQIHASKATHLERLMRVLVHSGFFVKVNNNDLHEHRYVLTQASLLLLKDSPSSLRPLVLYELDPLKVETVQLLSAWFQNDQDSSIVPLTFANNGMKAWDIMTQDGRLNSIFNDAMAGDSALMGRALISKCRGVFEGLNSLVDVGGGTGTLSKVIAKEFPQLKCTVFDLPHVVADLKGTHNLNYVAGDMFRQAIPPADAILLKFVLHDWRDDECVKMLKRCREAILCKEGGGKLIVLDIVIGSNENSDEEAIETQLLFDMVTMASVTGRERNEKEFAKLFSDAGFTNYKMTSKLGFRSLIEVYP